METKEMLNIICSVLDEKKAEDIKSINLDGKSIIADYFVICSGRSTTHVKSLADNLDEEMSKKYGIEPLRMEGKQDGKWAVVDYGDVIVHIFHQEQRKIYEIEDLWDDGKNIESYNLK
ncbi:MAG: ribosome silencing factor [Christensenella sp.]|nr:ribosome silencing factor [Christensenella sp.]